MQYTDFVVYSAKLQLFPSFGYWGSKDLLPSKHPSLEECKAACTGQLGAKKQGRCFFRRLYGEYRESRLWGFGLSVFALGLLGARDSFALLFSWATSDWFLAQRAEASPAISRHPPAHMRGRVWASGFGICPLSLDRVSSDRPGTEVAIPAQASNGLPGAVKFGHLPSAVSIRQSLASHA